MGRENMFILFSKCGSVTGYDSFTTNILYSRKIIESSRSFSFFLPVATPSLASYLCACLVNSSKSPITGTVDRLLHSRIDTIEAKPPCRPGSGRGALSHWLFSQFQLLKEHSNFPLWHLEHSCNTPLTYDEHPLILLQAAHISHLAISWVNLPWTPSVKPHTQSTF